MYDRSRLPPPSIDGDFESVVLVPQLELGNQTVSVRVSGTTITTFLAIGTATVSSAPADVFASVGDNLQVVWQYDNATGMWASYDPAAPAELNDLDSRSEQATSSGSRSPRTRNSRASSSTPAGT